MAGPRPSPPRTSVGSTAMRSQPLNASVFDIDCAAEAERGAARFRDVVGRQFRRRGVVIGLSGGVDSSVCAALAVLALGPSKVFGLLLPERDSSARGTDLGSRVARHLGIGYQTHDITSVLETIGCYRNRDEAIRRVFPQYQENWKSKLVIAGGLAGQFNFFNLVVQAPDGGTFQARVPHSAYLQIVAAQNYKQRIRKTVEYYHADRLNYVVVGTPNRLEYDQGFFVKNGDGSADLKPIAHLYKTQVYALARHFGLPDEICTARPTTDTYSLPQGQDEFFFALPYDQMDLALWAHDHQLAHTALADALGISSELAERIYRDIEAKRHAGAYLHTPPVVFEPTLLDSGTPSFPALHTDKPA
jgi:NAD+ synthase